MIMVYKNFFSYFRYLDLLSKYEVNPEVVGKRAFFSTTSLLYEMGEKKVTEALISPTISTIAGGGNSFVIHYLITFV